MVKFLKKCGLFLALLTLLNVIYLLILICYSPGFTKMYETSKFNNHNYEVLVLGNSMALDGIDAELLTENGMSAYNLSVAGDHISTSLFLLEEYLKFNEKPKIVVVGLSSAIGKSYLNPVPFTNPEVEFFYHPNWISNLSNPPMLNFQWLAVDLLKILISKDFRDANMVRGQWQTKKVIADNSVFKATNSIPVDYKDPYLMKLIILCESNGIQPVLTELPGSNSKRDNFPFEHSVELKNKTARTLYNLNNYEISSKILNASSDWLAPDHLNQSGGKKITKFLFQQILHKDLNAPTSKDFKQ